MALLDNRLFGAPPADYRPVPMWFWNGDLDLQALLRQVAALAEGGLGGFQIAARTGLSTPYLSERWFALVDQVSQAAEQRGLRVWLADEYPYPSGASGGEVLLRHPEYRAWHLRNLSVRVQPGERVERLAPGNVLLSAAAVPLVDGAADWTETLDLGPFVGLTQPEPVFTEPAFGLSAKRTFSFGPRPKLDWTAPAGHPQVDGWEVWLVAAAEVAPFKFFGSYVDLCNPEAVRAFLETTYQRYADRLDPAALHRLSGFFLDEAHPPSWSWTLPEVFQRRNGYDLIPLLPALWTDIGPRTALVRHAYWQTLTERFMETFHRPVAEWCAAHGLQLSLEVDSLRNLVQRFAPIGGNDPGHEKVGATLDELQTAAPPRYRAHPRFSASLAAQVGQRRVLVEPFHSTGWSLTLQDMKAMVDRLAAQGADFFVFHAFLYSLGGLRKWDAPPSQFVQNPYWPFFPRFAAYVGRLCYALSRGRRAAPVALLDPITSLWTHGGSAGGGGLGRPDAVATRLAADWRYLLRELEAAQRHFDTLDPLLLAEGRVEQGTLRLGDAAYHVIILPPLASLEQAAWAKLEEFAAAGGSVVACGLLPYEQIEDGSDVPARCAARFGADPARLRRAYESGTEAGRSAAHQRASEAPGRASRPEAVDAQVSLVVNGSFTLLRTTGTLEQAGAAGSLLSYLEREVPANVQLLPAGGDEARRAFLVAERREGDEALYFLVNAGPDEHACAVALRVPTASAGSALEGLGVERLDLEDGSCQALACDLAQDADGVPRLELQLRFPPYGAHLLAVRASEGAAPRQVAVETAEVAEIMLATGDAWECSLGGDNALRLDRFSFGVGLAEESGPPKVRTGWPLVEPKPLINLLRELDPEGRAWPVPLRVDTPFGSPAQIRLRLPVAAWYVAEFEVATLPARAALCLESPALLGEWTLWLNGEALPREAFASRYRWDETNLELDVCSRLRLGRNQLAVRVVAGEQTDGLVDALYLLGDFGVEVGPDGVPALTTLLRRVHWDRFEQEGLPSYAGALRLSSTIELAPRSAAPRVALRLPDDLLMYLGVARLSVNGRDLGPRLWAPYRWDVPDGVLRAGPNAVTVTVTTTLAGLLEGKRYDPVRRSAVRIAE